MAFENPKNIIPGIKAGEDLSSHQYKFCVLNSSGDAILNTVAGAAVDGVLQEPVISSGTALQPLSRPPRSHRLLEEFRAFVA